MISLLLEEGMSQICMHLSYLSLEIISLLGKSLVQQAELSVYLSHLSLPVTVISEHSFQILHC